MELNLMCMYNVTYMLLMTYLRCPDIAVLWFEGPFVCTNKTVSPLSADFTLDGIHLA